MRHWLDRFLALFFLLVLCAPGAVRALPSEKKESEIIWREWSTARFEEGRKDNKLVLLYLEAVWCHWCHVMDQTTYHSPEVRMLIADHFVPIKVDQDAHPELSNRYKRYGWPATIFFNADGEEVVKRRGYVEPEHFVALLQELIADPAPRADEEVLQDIQYPDAAVLSKKLRNQLIARHYGSADPTLGALELPIKRLFPDSVEYSMIRAARSDQKDAEMVQRTLLHNLKLFDPVWGGVYQYSTHKSWDHPHYEKLLSRQAENLRSYALAYSLFENSSYLRASREVFRYVKDFLTSPSGPFYSSQDADMKKGTKADAYFALGDSQRRALGVPQIDQASYSDSNGEMIQAFAALYDATGNVTILDDAITAAEWMEIHRMIEGGGFSHGEKDTNGPFLVDSLEMARAFLALYQSTAERVWLTKSVQAAEFIKNNFVNDEPGFFSARESDRAVLLPTRILEENVRAVRFFNLLSHYTGNEAYAQLAAHGMRYLASPTVALRSITQPGILIADEELNAAPLHLVVVGSKADPNAKALYLEALRYFSPYKRVEWFDRTEGKLPNHDVEYPELEHAAAFVCTKRRCSFPISNAGRFREMVNSLVSKRR